MRHCLFAVLAILALAFTQAVAQNKSEKHSLAGAKIFIAPMQGDLHPFIAAEIVKKKLPVVVVTEKENAEYILAGTFIKGDGKWYHTAFGPPPYCRSTPDIETRHQRISSPAPN